MPPPHPTPPHPTPPHPTPPHPTPARTQVAHDDAVRGVPAEVAARARHGRGGRYHHGAAPAQRRASRRGGAAVPGPARTHRHALRWVYVPCGSGSGVGGRVGARSQWLDCVGDGLCGSPEVRNGGHRYGQLRAGRGPVGPGRPPAPPSPPARHPPARPCRPHPYACTAGIETVKAFSYNQVSARMQYTGLSMEAAKVGLGWGRGGRDGLPLVVGYRRRQ